MIKRQQRRGLIMQRSRCEAGFRSHVLRRLAVRPM
jgi:hypothetical protein